MKNIEIIISGCGYENFYQGYVCIYDLNNNLVYEGETYNGRICFDACLESFYTIKVSYFRGLICKTFYVPCDIDYPIIINKYTKIKKRAPITINLEDANYEGLNIEKGEINLWQNLTQ